MNWNYTIHDTFLPTDSENKFKDKNISFTEGFLFFEIGLFFKILTKIGFISFYLLKRASFGPHKRHISIWRVLIFFLIFFGPGVAIYLEPKKIEPKVNLPLDQGLMTPEPKKADFQSAHIVVDCCISGSIFWFWVWNHGTNLVLGSKCSLECSRNQKLLSGMQQLAVLCFQMQQLQQHHNIEMLK